MEGQLELESSSSSSFALGSNSISDSDWKLNPNTQIKIVLDKLDPQVETDSLHKQRPRGNEDQVNLEIKREFEEVYPDDRDPENVYIKNLETEELYHLNLKTEIKQESPIFDPGLLNFKIEQEQPEMSIFDLCPVNLKTETEPPYVLYDPDLVNSTVTQGKSRESSNCSICNARFHQTCSLNRHLTQFHADVIQPAFPCSYCEDKFLCEGSMTSHSKRVHPQQYGFTCHLCENEKKFPNSIYLKWHIRATHTDTPRVKPHMCKICGKCFTKATTLTNHIGTHNGEKQKPRPRVRKTCGKKFSKVKLTKQKKIKKIPMAETSDHTCENCGRRFMTKSQLVSHSKVHATEKPYKCNICGENYLFPRQLALHEKIHGKDKSRVHECEHCGKYFSSSRFLNVHRISHQSEKQFECVQCKKSFKFITNLMTHVKKSH